MHHHHQHHHYEVKRAPAPDVITSNGVVMSVVYVTAQPTFTGVIGGYSTVTQDDSETAEQTQAATAATTDLETPAVATSNTQAAISATASGTTAAGTGIRSSSVQAVSSSRSILNFATASGVSSITAISSTLTSATGSSRTNNALAGAATTDSSSTNTAASGGMSAGAKAGLALGILFAIGAATALCLILLAKKRRQNDKQARLDSEKHQFENNRIPTPVMASSANAPRLSLRPVSRLVPDLMGGARPKSRLSQGNMLTTFKESSNESSGHNLSPAAALGNASAHRAVTQTPSVQENPFSDPENPFADPEKNALNHQAAPVASLIQPSPAVQKSASHAGPTVFPTPTQAATNPVSAAAPAPIERAVETTAPGQKQSFGPTPISIPAPSSVAPGAPSPVVAPGPGPDLPQGNVYRILMDFNPTMEDELGLRAGQHVRLLHEYDDGWALCIRLDRSQQGVVPRTCLAPKPSKPRPAPGARGPGTNSPHAFRNGPPQSGRSSPAASRPITPNNASKSNVSLPMGTPSNAGPTGATLQQGSPALRPVSPGGFNQAPRPLSPGPRPQKRSMSPGPYGASGPKPMAGVSQRRRSNSASALNVRERRNSPPGPSKLGPGLPVIRSDSPGLAM